MVHFIQKIVYIPLTIENFGFVQPLGYDFKSKPYPLFLQLAFKKSLKNLLHLQLLPNLQNFLVSSYLY